jgi:hypothetical protein
LRVWVALALALLCSVPLFGSSAGRAATSPSPASAKCYGYKGFRLSSATCEYRYGQPFVLKGYSKGGPSTLSYTVRCGNGPTWPMKSAAIDRRVWYRRSTTVRGAFSVYGAKGTPLAAKHCVAASGKAPLLTVKLKMSKTVTRTNLLVRMDSSLPWGD